MRITHGTFYNQYTKRQEESIGNLNKTYEKVTSARQISNGYEDPSKMSNTLNLDAQEAFFNQINNIAKRTVDFSRNSDSALGEIQTTLTQFEQKLINAANGNHSPTSLNSISKEMSVLVEHLRGIMNTSVNNNYLFSGSSVTKQPIDENFQYKGNRDDMGILLGRSDIESTYNVNGYDVLYGNDSDKQKHISTNIKILNKRLLYPNVMTKDLKKDSPQKVYINSQDSIRDMMGDNNDNVDDNKKSIFYIRGTDTSGDLIKEKIVLDGSDKIRTLLQKIETAYGNFVKASINADGQIELISTIKGNSKIDFHIVGAIDRSVGGANLADVDDVNKLADIQDVDIVEFVYSNLPIAKTKSSILSFKDSLDKQKVYLRSSFIKASKEQIKLQDKVKDIVHQKLNKLSFSGVDLNGKAFSKDFTIDENTIMRDLYDQIKVLVAGGKENKYKVTVSMINDKIVIQENQANSNNKETKISLKVTANDGNLKAFSLVEGLNIDAVGFSKDKNILSSQVSQITKTGEYATRNTLLRDVSKNNLDGTKLKLDVTNMDGVLKHVDILISKDNSSFVLDGKKYNIINDSVFYIAPKSTLNVIKTPDDYDLNGVKAGDIISINSERRTVKNVDNLYKTITLDKPLTKRITSGSIVNFEQPNSKRVTSKNITYGQIMDIVSLVMSNNIPASSSVEDYKKSLNKASESIDIKLDLLGKMQVKDKVHSVSRIGLAIYDADSNDFENKKAPTLLFNANNAVVVSDPSVSFFKTLQDATYAVKNGILSRDAYSRDARNIGIRGAIKAVAQLGDHIAKMRTTAGTNSQTIENTISRIKGIITSTRALKSKTISTDIAKTMVKFNEQSLNYSALLKIVSKINELSLVNFLR